MKILQRYRSRHGLGEERGQSLVETALVSPILLLLLLGIVDFGWFAYNYIELANAANAGVHYAAQNTATAADTPAIQAAMNSDAANMTSISPTVSMACTCSDGTAVTCTNYVACTVPARLIDTVTVTATKTVSPLVNWPGIPNSVTLHSSAVMQVEQ
ncbi:MAG TPA: TadE/TadG family type IV pilus assembly protein [Bryobacteraceae bacterium]|jgi:Flp pilus assembly protein TadG